ncbi:MAG: IS5 family transposase [Alphaproteobacteria bacterium]|nr:IS5 family transposase [Alphaproteobacteria bacterium]
MGCLAPLLPADTRGKPRVDDRRVISGIVQVLRSGCPWRHAPREYGPPKTLYNRYVRWAIKGVWRRLFEALATAGGPPAEVLLDATYAKAHRSASGGKGGKHAQAIGRSRGGRTTKIHAAANQGGKPIAFHLSGGNTADLRGGEALIDAVPEGALVIADRAFDADRFRRSIEARGAVPNIPPKTNRRWKSCFSPALYRNRNAIERMFCRLKDFRRVATRYDRLAATYLAAVHIAAIVAFWL